METVSNKEPIKRWNKIKRAQQLSSTKLTVSGKKSPGLTRTPSLPDGHLKARSTRASIAPAPAMAPYQYVVYIDSN
jgi:hypothetical protein